MTKKSAKAAYHHGDLRAALVAAARAMVERDGADAVSLRAVAKAAGVSQAAPYHHFADKQALLSAVAAGGFRDFTAMMLSRVKDADPPQHRLNMLGLGYVEFALRHPLLFKMLEGAPFQSDDTDPELSEARRASLTPLIEIVSACLPGADEDAINIACAAAWSLVHGMATLWNDGRLDVLIDTSDLDKAVLAITGHMALERCLTPSAS
ncbi:MAG: TetR/AcrR family transcriptional regulator [Parvularculaceae bacterium]